MTTVFPQADKGSAPPVRAADWRWWAAIGFTVCMVLVAVVLVVGVAPGTDDLEPYFINRVEIATGNTADQPSPRWEPASLPYHCPVDSTTYRCDLTFRIIYHYDPAAWDGNAALPADGRALAVYAPSFIGVISVSLNGVTLNSNRRDRTGSDMSGTIPFYTVVPTAFLRPGDNEFRIQLEKIGVLSGSFSRIAIAPDALLHPHYQLQSFLSSTLLRMVDGWQISMGILLLVIWLARPRELIFLLAGFMLLGHVMQALPAVLGGSLVSDEVLRFANHGRIVAGCLILPLACLFIGRRPPLPIPAFLILPLVTMIGYLTLPIGTYRVFLTVVCIPPLLGSFAWAVVLVFNQAIRHRDIASLLLGGAFLISLIIGTNDVAIVAGTAAEGRVLLGRFTGPIVMAVICAVLVWRFARTMNVLDQFSQRLKREVADAEAALRESFVRERAQAQATVLEAERVRLMSDLHDGIAGQLVSILALCELNREGDGPVAVAVGSALADLRLVVASLEDSGDDLGVMLALFRERIEPQLAAQGVALQWRVQTLPEIKGLHPGATLNIFRILQEAAINAARHSGSPTVAIEAGASPEPGYRIRLCVRDRGCGGVAPRRGSYGLGNMQRRAAALGAVLDIQSGADGTSIILDLPEQLPGPIETR